MASDLRGALQRLVDGDADSRSQCAQLDDCPCSYKDCYECGKWHNCIHTPYTELRYLLAEHP